MEGTLTALEARLADLEARDAAKAERIAGLERQLVAGQEQDIVINPLDDAETGGHVSDASVVEVVNAVVAGRTETPLNFHQATVHFCAVETEDAAKVPLMLCAGLMMVMMQTIAAIAVTVGTGMRSCSSSDQCDQGRFCWIFDSTAGPEAADDVTKGTDRCGFCGNVIPLPRQTEGTCRFELNGRGTDGLSIEESSCATWNWPFDPNFVGTNKTLVVELCTEPDEQRMVNSVGVEITFARAAMASWCEKCVAPIDGNVDTLDEQDVVDANVHAMETFDLVCLCVAALVLAGTVVGELKE